MAKEKFPLLQQLRAERRRLEDEITAPFKEELAQAAADIRSLNRRLSAIERALGDGVAKQIESRMASELANKLMALAYEAASKAEGPFEPVTITVPPEVARFMLPSTIEAEICRRYRSDVLPSLRLSVDEMASAEAYATVMDVRLPPLGFRHVVQNRH